MSRQGPLIVVRIPLQDKGRCVSAKGAESGELGGELRTGANINGIAANSTPFPSTLAPALLKRLAREGLDCIEAWRALYERKRDHSRSEAA